MFQSVRTTPMRPRRQRKLQIMTSSERGRYYRRRSKILDAQEKHVEFLRRDVHRLQIQLEIAQDLSRQAIPPNLSSVSSFLSRFITERHDASAFALQHGRLEVRSVAMVGSMDVPVVQLDYILRGHLHQELVPGLYEFVGNSFALEKMTFEEAEYACTHFFFFSSMERFIVERDVVGAFRGYLGSLRALEQALEDPWIW